MTDLITTPGIYDVDESDYHDMEICDSPSISSSGLRTIDKECPAIYWWNSNLNPDREPVVKKPWTFGKAAHFYILEGEKMMRDRFTLIDDKLNLNSKEGKGAKAEAAESGKQLLRAKEVKAIKAMADALAAHDFAGAAFKNCHMEKTLVWKDKETGIWLRCRPDALPKKIVHIPDYKTTISARPSKFASAIWDYGYHCQAQLYLEGIRAVTGVKPLSFVFIVQEKKPPYVVSSFVLDPDALEWAKIQNHKAIHIFADCLESGRWPGYVDDIHQINLPPWAQNELWKRDGDGDFLTSESKTA